MNQRRFPRRRRSIAALAAGAVAALNVVGCSGTDAAATDVDAFCTQASANQAMIVAPPLANQEQITATMEFYRLMGDLAPVEIADDWEQLHQMLITANDLVPGDEASEQLVAQTAYAAESAAYDIAIWIEKNCGLTLPITTIVSHTIPPAQPPLDTYVPPPTTEAVGVSESAPTATAATTPSTTAASG